MDKLISFLSAPIFSFLGKISDMFQRYFPPKTPAEKEQDIADQVHKQEQIEDQGGPPKWD